jgi:hypothetical protein
MLPGRSIEVSSFDILAILVSKGANVQATGIAFG